MCLHDSDMIKIKAKITTAIIHCSQFKVCVYKYIFIVTHGELLFTLFTDLIFPLPKRWIFIILGSLEIRVLLPQPPKC